MMVFIELIEKGVGRCEDRRFASGGIRDWTAAAVALAVAIVTRNLPASFASC
jgi:hypothetical protein